MILLSFVDSLVSFYLAILPNEPDRAACVVSGTIAFALCALMLRDYLLSKRVEYHLQELEKGAQEAGANQ